MSTVIFVPVRTCAASLPMVQQESADMSRGPSPCVANWPMVGMGPAGGMMPAPHMQQAPHLMPVSGAPPAPYAFGGFFASGGNGMAGGMVGGLQYGGGMTGIMPGYMPSGMHSGMHPAIKGSGGGGGMLFGGGMPGGGMHMEYGAGGGAGPMQPMPLPSMWPGDSGTIWLPGGGGMFPMLQGGDGKSQQFCGKQFANLQEPTGQTASGLWSSSGSVQSSQSDFAHPAFPQTVAQAVAPPQPSPTQPEQQRQELHRRSMDELPPSGRLSSEWQRPQGGQAMDAQAAVPQPRAQRLRSHRRAAKAQQQQQQQSPQQLKANSAPKCKPELEPPMTQQQAAMQQQQQAAAMQQGFYDAMGAYGMPSQMPAGMAGLLPGCMAPWPAGCAMPTGGALPMMVSGVYSSMHNMAVAPLLGAAAASLSQPQSSDSTPQPQHEQQLQQRPQLGQLATMPRAGFKRTSSGALGSGRGGGGAGGGAGDFRSQPGTPRSEALVLAELKALISQLDPAMKSTMKDSLYRISRHALVRFFLGNGLAGELSA